MPAVAGMDRGDMALQELLAVDAAFTMPFFTYMHMTFILMNVLFGEHDCQKKAIPFILIKLKINNYPV